MSRRVSARRMTDGLCERRRRHVIYARRAALPQPGSCTRRWTAAAATAQRPRVTDRKTADMRQCLVCTRCLVALWQRRLASADSSLSPVNCKSRMMRLMFRPTHAHGATCRSFDRPVRGGVSSCGRAGDRPYLDARYAGARSFDPILCPCGS